MTICYCVKGSAICKLVFVKNLSRFFSTQRYHVYDVQAKVSSSDQDRFCYTVSVVASFYHLKDVISTLFISVYHFLVAKIKLRLITKFAQLASKH